MELDNIGIVELAAILGTCLIALATYIFIKDKSISDEFKAVRHELMELNNGCVKREELHTLLTAMRQDISEIRQTIMSVFDKTFKKQ